MFVLAQLLIWCEMEAIYSKINYKVKARKTHPCVCHLRALQKLRESSFELGSLTVIRIQRVGERDFPNVTQVNKFQYDTLWLVLMIIVSKL